MKYRIDFTRLARDPEEIIREENVTDFLVLLSKEFGNNRSREVIENHKNSWPEGHILDSMIVEDDPDLIGPEIMKNKIVPIYPEAKLQSWGCILEDRI